jgi:hypothetical protein
MLPQVDDRRVKSPSIKFGIGGPGDVILISQVLSIQTSDGNCPFPFTGRPNYQRQGVQWASEVKVASKVDLFHPTPDVESVILFCPPTTQTPNV